MIFWILVAILSAAVTYWVTRPLLDERQDAVEPALADIAVYKDQLAEIDADLARGQLTEGEASGARAEVARRLLRLPQAAAQASDGASGAKPLKGLHMAATIALPLLSLALYLAYGNPAMPGLPFKDRLATAPEKASAADLIAKVEERLRQEPNDGRGWEVIAPVYVAQGRFPDAVEAYARAMRLLGETPHRLEGMAIADVRAANGLVTELARKAFSRALELEPGRIEPQLWLTLAKEQDGKTAEATADYKALLANAAPDAPWRKAVEARLEALQNEPASAEKPADRPADGAPPGNQAGSVAALPAQQRAMIDEMVAGLAARLKANGDDLEGWLRLVRSLKVLGRDAEAATALADARRQFAANTQALETIDGLAKSLGLGS